MGGLVGEVIGGWWVLGERNLWGEVCQPRGCLVSISLSYVSTV